MGRKVRGPRPKHVPQRTCIACRQVAGKRNLVRLVRTAGGVEIDPTGKKAGRGAYLHPYQECWQAGLRTHRIEQALRTRLTEPERTTLAAYMAGLLPTRAEDETAMAGTPIGASGHETELDE